jgi:hypothetical protein
MRRPTFLAQAGFIGGVFFTFLFCEFFFVFSESEHKLGITPVLQIAPLSIRARDTPPGHAVFQIARNCDLYPVPRSMGPEHASRARVRCARAVNPGRGSALAVKFLGLASVSASRGRGRHL